MTETTTVRGAEIGHQTTGDGPDLVWGHGLTQSRALEDVDPLVDWLRVPVRVTRYDARGHGVSTTTPDPDDYSWSALALDQLELASALGIDRYVAAGASMGCATALHAAIAAPDRITGLVLVIPPTGWETRAAQIDQYGATAHVLATRGVEPVLAARAGLPVPDPFVGDERRAARQEAGLRSWDPERLAQVFRGATRADLPARNAIATVTVPALILAWTGDPAHPASSAEELAALLPTNQCHLAATAAEVEGWTDLVAGFVRRLVTT
ncbi:MAG: alpha/beta fold hydrolase [Acidimicrobiales bacterium]